MSIKITRGYPGSGKTRLAVDWVKSGPKRARVNRDDLRAMNFAAEGVLPFALEQEITEMQVDQVTHLVKSGFDVIIDDMNLRLKYARRWADLALQLGVDFEVIDVDTPMQTCIALDAKRAHDGGRYVGPEVIKKIAGKFPIGRWPAVTPSDKFAARAWPVYTPDTSLPEAIIVDIDGTIAAKRLGEGERGWHEYHRVGEDDPKDVILDIVDALHYLGATAKCYGRAGAREVEVIFVSGRKQSCQRQTRDWLRKHLGEWADGAHLMMRETDDNRADDIVKNEIFEQRIAPRFNVLFTLDDRQRVVDMWRAKGITCLQVDAWAEAGK